METVLINDRVYGSIEIKEPVLIELINSKPLQRLKKIEQFGVPSAWYCFPGFSRFEHSVGVLILLKKLNASLKEQIAGLLHDVSHTAFSHVADWVFGSTIENEDLQDLIHKKILIQSEIPKILEKYSFKISEVSKIEDFGLLERSIPDLCADRVDYALREFMCWTNKEIVPFLFILLL